MWWGGGATFGSLSLSLSLSLFVFLTHTRECVCECVFVCYLEVVAGDALREAGGLLLDLVGSPALELNHGLKHKLCASRNISHLLLG